MDADGLPLIVAALAVVAIFGTGVQNVIVAITVPLVRAARRAGGALRSARCRTSTPRTCASVGHIICATWYPAWWRHS
jgi:hypothetical protein